jgi:hypothetical protein
VVVTDKADTDLVELAVEMLMGSPDTLVVAVVSAADKEEIVCLTLVPV